jgi:hypothetical protein
MWISHVASKTLSAHADPTTPAGEDGFFDRLLPRPPDGLPLLAGGSAPARKNRGLLRVHVLCGLRIRTSVAPRTSPEASTGRLLELGCSSGYRANRQFPGRDLHPLAFETQEVSPYSETQLTSDLLSCRTARHFLTRRRSPPAGPRS